MQRTKNNSGHVAVFALVLALTILGLILFIFIKVKDTNKTEVQTSGQPISYQVMLIAQSQVKALKTAPTLAALQYAYVANAYTKGLEIGGQGGALQMSDSILSKMYPKDSDSIQSQILSIASASGIQYSAQSVPATIKESADTLAQRYDTDGHDAVWDGVIPTGPDKWQKTLPADPFTPLAGSWKRWNVATAISVPPPPASGSAEDLKELENVRQVSASRNGEDVNTINFWGGVPGSESPAGIWQNQLKATVTNDLPADSLEADTVYAGLQNDLAQTISDAFMECWKVKYTYWTARPSMRDSSIKTAMPNPNFPSYVSGHSTISKAAADLLSVEAPKHKAAWQSMAVEARDSRLKAGIHYEIDNKVGFELGAKVAEQSIIGLNAKNVF